MPIIDATQYLSRGQNFTSLNDVDDVREAFHEHRKYLMTSMLDDQEGLNWDGSPMLNYFKWKFPVRAPLLFRVRKDRLMARTGRLFQCRCKDTWKRAHGPPEHRKQLRPPEEEKISITRRFRIQRAQEAEKRETKVIRNTTAPDPDCRF